jgi:hypothetical protein
MRTNKTQTKDKKPTTPREIALRVAKFEKRRKQAMARIDELQENLRQIDAEVTAYLEGLLLPCV